MFGGGDGGNRTRDTARVCAALSLHAFILLSFRPTPAMVSRHAGMLCAQECTFHLGKMLCSGHRIGRINLQYKERFRIGYCSRGVCEKGEADQALAGPV